MKKSVRLLGFLTACACAALSGLANGQDQPGPPLPAEFQGKWWTRIVVPATRATITQVIEIKGDTITTASKDGKMSSVGRVKIDPTASPKTLDIVDNKMISDVIKDFKLPDVIGIYEFEGGALKICSNIGAIDKKRPTEFKADLRAGVSLVTYRRGDPPPEPSRSGFGAEPTTIRVAVVKADRYNVTLRTAEGKNLTFGAYDAEKATDPEGNPIADARQALKAGNILDVSVVEIRSGRSSSLHIKDAHVVSFGPGNTATAPARPKAAAPATATASAPTWKRAEVAKINPYNFVLAVDGEQVVISKGVNNAKAYDASGAPLPKGSAGRMFRVGNVVDVIVSPKVPRELFARLREIRMVKGELLDEPPK
jgi:uncharacterized protein (TIGR03067 family)